MAASQPSVAARTAWIVMAVVVPMGIIALMLNASGKYEIKPGVTDLASFERLLNSDGDFEYTRLERDGEWFLEASAYPPSWALPSGPTCYVFDAEGKLVGWVRDSGDSPQWQQKWGDGWKREPLGSAEDP